MCSTEAGSRPENVRKNRYKDVLPCKSVVGVGPPEESVPPPCGIQVLARVPCPTGIPELSLPEPCCGCISPQHHTSAPRWDPPRCAIPCWLSSGRPSGLSPTNSMFLTSPAGRRSDTSDPFPAPGRGTWRLHQWQLHQGQAGSHERGRGGGGDSRTLIVNLAFTRVQTEARPTSPRKDPCLTPC